MHKSGGQGLVFHSSNIIPAEPTPPKGPPPVKKSYEAVPSNFKVPSSTTKRSVVQRSSSVGPVKCNTTTLIKISLFSHIASPAITDSTKKERYLAAGEYKFQPSSSFY